MLVLKIRPDFFFFFFVYFPSKCSGAEKYQNMLIHVDPFNFLVPKANLDFGPILGPLFKTNGVVS